jgi:RNA polymerase sigma-70 factor, ECF subfamily
MMDSLAVRRAYEQYAPLIYARCRRILRDEQGARDATQDVFERCFRRRGELRDARELLSWLYRTATNACLNTLRNARTRREHDAALAHTSSGAVDGPSGVGQVVELLRGLDERTQAIAIYVYVDGMTQQEAAELAQVTDRTVRNCLARFVAHGRRSLGIDLQEDCG